MPRGRGTAAPASQTHQDDAASKLITKHNKQNVLVMINFMVYKTPADRKCNVI